MPPISGHRWAVNIREFVVKVDHLDDRRLQSSHALTPGGNPMGPHIEDKPSTYRGSEEMSESRRGPQDGIDAKKVVAAFNTPTSSRNRRFSAFSHLIPWRSWLLTPLRRPASMSALGDPSA